MKFYHASAVDSERVAFICDDEVTLINLTNPSAPATSILNWITAGYTDGQSLTGLDSGLQNTLPSLTLTVKSMTDNTFGTIWQGGVAVTANRVPFIIRSVAPTVPMIDFNVPRTPGTVYRFTFDFKKPTGEQKSLTWDVTILAS